MRKNGMCFVAICLLFCLEGYSKPLTKKEIFQNASSRIEQYRKTQTLLTLLDVEGNPLPSGVDVHIEQTCHEFLFGCNFFKWQRCQSENDNRLYEQRFKDLFNYATLGFYWRAYERQPDKTEAEHWKAAADWCTNNGITAKGHPLFWTIEPQWVGQMPQDKQMELLFGRIGREVSDFTGKVAIWDVLNEPGVGIKQGKQRNAVAAINAYKTLGTTGTILKAFNAARSASPKALLILNDYDTSQTFEKIIQDCLDKNTPIDVIGIQSHQHNNIWPVEKIWDVCERFARFQKPLHFTETTFVSGPGKWEDWQKTTSEGEQKQAEEAALFYTILFSHPAVEAITWWDLSDQGAWQKAPAGLIRADMSVKPAYERLRKLIKETWWTRTDTKTNTLGKITLQGFLGRYVIQVKAADKTLTGTFTLDKNSTSQTIQLKE